jgi:methylmalonyl-CoA mutase C-terminal domain/subunit
MKQKTASRSVKILVAKLGLDGHDRGALVLCRAFRDAGMEVIYSGLFATPNRIAQIAEDEDVDAIAMSLLNGAHGTLFPRVVKELKKKKINDVLVVGGGVIPDVDHKDLIKAGIDHVYGPGTTLPTIIDHINNGVSKLRKNFLKL